MSDETASRGRYFEDFEPGQVFRSHIGRTVTQADNIWFTCVTMNPNQRHFNVPFAEATPFGKPLVNSCFTLALVTGLTVADTSQNATNLEWSKVIMPNPLFEGDTVWAETEVLEKRESASRPGTGIVTIRTRGINQRGEVVIEFRRVFLVASRDTVEAAFVGPGTDESWRV